MIKIPDDIQQQLEQTLRRSVGSVTMRGEIEGLFDRAVPGGIVFEFVADPYVYRVERDANLQLLFYHSYPGKGTRVATIDLTKVKESQRVFWGFTWSPNETQLFIGPEVPDGELTFATGVESKKQFKVTPAGLFQLGDSGVEVMEARVYAGGASILQPTAREAWSATNKAIDFLQSGKSDGGYVYEVVICNVVISTLVTGFETYCNTRFIELEREGANPNTDNLVSRFFSAWEQEANLPSKVEDEAKEEQKTFLEKLATVEAG